MRFQIHCARICANGKLNIQTFWISEDKSKTLSTENNINKYLRSKLEKKGNYRYWSRYGSWTLENENKPNTLPRVPEQHNVDTQHL